jgi:hypothetical protein
VGQSATGDPQGMGNCCFICDQVRSREHRAASGQTMNETFSQMSAIETAAYFVCLLVGVFGWVIVIEFFFGKK